MLPRVRPVKKYWISWLVKSIGKKVIPGGEEPSSVPAYKKSAWGLRKKLPLEGPRRSYRE